MALEHVSVVRWRRVPFVRKAKYVLQLSRNLHPFKGKVHCCAQCILSSAPCIRSGIAFPLPSALNAASMKAHSCCGPKLLLVAFRRKFQATQLRGSKAYLSAEAASISALSNLFLPPPLGRIKALVVCTARVLRI